MNLLIKRVVFLLLFIICNSKAFTQIAETRIAWHKSVLLPFEASIEGNEVLIIKKEGIIEFGNKVFVFKKDGVKYPIQNKADISVYGKNNLLGVNVTELIVDGFLVLYTFIINIETQKEIFYEKVPRFLFWDFFSIKNYFIVVSDEKAYAFNDSTGELIWTQTYRQKNGQRIMYYEDHFIINDKDGNNYKILEDGKKIKL
jgi:hypothetical protein